MQPEQRMSKKRRRELRAQTTRAFILAILFVLSAVTTLLATNLEASLFNTKTYQSALEDMGLYEQLPALAARQLHFIATYDLCHANPMACRFPNALPQTRACLDVTLGADLVGAVIRNERSPTPAQIGAAQDCFTRFGTPEQIVTPPAPGPALFAFFTPQQIETILKAVVSPEELRTFGNQALKETLAYASGERATVTLWLGWLKRSLSSRGPDAVSHAIQEQPACTAEQETRIARDLNANHTPRDLFACSLPEGITTLLRPFITKGVNSQAALIPETLTISTLPAVPGTLTRSIPLARHIIRYAWLLPLALLSALSLVIVRGWKSWLMWWGMPLMLTGILALGFSVFSLFALPTTVQQLIAGSLPPILLPEIAATLKTLVIDVAGNALAPLTIQSIALSAAGLGMLIAARLIKH